MDGCEPETGERGESAIHRAVEIGVGRGRNFDAYKLHRRLAEDPRRLAGRVAIDHSTRRVVCRLVDARNLQRRRRDPGRVAVLAAPVRRAPAGCLVKLPPRRERWVRPRVVVPARTNDPTLLRQPRGPRLNSLQRRLEAARAGQVEAEVAFRQALEMDMRVDETRPGGSA